MNPAALKFHQAANGVLQNYRNPLEGAVAKKWSQDALVSLLGVSHSAAKRYLKPNPGVGGFSEKVVNSLIKALQKRLDALNDSASERTRTALRALIDALESLDDPKVVEKYANAFQTGLSRVSTGRTTPHTRIRNQPIEWKSEVDSLPFVYDWPLAQKPRHALLTVWFALQGPAQLQWLARALNEGHTDADHIAKRCEQNLSVLEHALRAMSWAIRMNAEKLEGFGKTDKTQMRISFYMRVPAPAGASGDAPDYLCRILRIGEDSPGKRANSTGSAALVPLNPNSRLAICTAMASNEPHFVVGDEADRTLEATPNPHWQTLAVLARSMALKKGDERDGVLAIDIRAPRGPKKQHAAALAHLRWLSVHRYSSSEMMRNAILMARESFFTANVRESITELSRQVDIAAKG